ncbi:unnamed protein product [Porites lobata]|uniref:tryptophan--tRNA ligase n=1 Tax=Porites lobata TaxID=104759 RepID=A0ABN8QKC6_9CNID|nr:unnamed protein product [Porites lobata]
MRIFSGIQPTGTMHIGNYLGAIKNWVSLQEESEGAVIYSIVDLHSLTLPQDPASLQQSIRNMAIYLLACGVSQHVELAWILGCMAPTGFLNRMHQWKTKGNENKEQSCLGLYSYPVLMAADILLYKATHVPIGEDQLQHLELARELCRLFNSKYGVFFPVPKAILGNFKRVMSLRDATTKMSKSDPQEVSRIELSDSPDIIKTKIQKATTDSEKHISYDPQNRPEMSNLINIYAEFSGLSHQQVCDRYQNMEKCKKAFKADLTELIASKLSFVRDNISKIQQDESYVDSVLSTGALRARNIAEANLQEIKHMIGLR